MRADADLLHIAPMYSLDTLCGLARFTRTFVVVPHLKTLHPSWDESRCESCFNHPTLPLLLLEITDL